MLGIILIVVAIMYWSVPAGSLPTFMPGYDAGSTLIHVKHGVVTFILGVLVFTLTWFKTGKKPAGKR